MRNSLRRKFAIAGLTLAGFALAQEAPLPSGSVAINVAKDSPLAVRRP